MGILKTIFSTPINDDKAPVCIGEYTLEKIFIIMKEDSQQMSLKLSKAYHKGGKRMGQYECIKSWNELPSTVDQLKTIYSIQINERSLNVYVTLYVLM